MTDITTRSDAGAYATPDEEAVAWAMLDGQETRARTFSESEVEILTGHASTMTSSGFSVSAQSALKISAVFACCRVIAEDVAKMRRFVMRKTFNPQRGTAESREEWFHPLASIVADYWCDPRNSDIRPGHPNTWMTGFEFWEYMVFGAALYGMSAAWIVRDPSSGRVVELLPLRPGSCQPEIDARGWVVGYRVYGYGETFVARTGDVLVLRGPMADEINAFEPVRLAREAIGLAAAIENSQTKFHKNDMRPSGALFVDVGPERQSSPGQSVIERLREELRGRYAPGGDGGIAIFDKKFEFKEFTAKSTDAQTIENRRFQIEEICRVFRVNPSKIMHQGAAQKGTVEQDALSHVSDTTGIWAKRCEECCARDLVDRNDPADAGIYVDFDDAASVRGTMAERMSGYERMLKAGWTPNEVRIIEGYDPLPIPEADRPQFLANNTGLAPTPLSGGAADSRPAKEQDDPGAAGAAADANAAQPLVNPPAATPLSARPLGERPMLPKPAGKSALQKGLAYVRSQLG